MTAETVTAWPASRLIRLIPLPGRNRLQRRSRSVRRVRARAARPARPAGPPTTTTLASEPITGKVTVVEATVDPVVPGSPDRGTNVPNEGDTVPFNPGDRRPILLRPGIHDPCRSPLMTTVGTASASDDRRFFLSSFAALTSVAAFLLAGLGLVVVTAVGPSTSASSGSGPAKVSIDLTELKISPANLTAPAGNVVLSVMNSGTMAHNVAVPALGAKTADLAAGQSAELDLGSVAAGTYELRCEIPGHAEGGMRATLVVSEGGSASAASTASAATDWSGMDARMTEGMTKGLDTFVKGGSTAGVGNEKLAPTVEADGTKVFHLTSAITDWEVAPGQVVQAWSYNGMVPGPWIRTEPGDKVKVVLENKLPVSTDIHFHGITTPFSADGVAPLTQDFIKPGETYVYQWTNPDHPEMGMYHAHAHGNTAVLNGLFAVFQIGDMSLPSGQVTGKAVPAIGRPTYEMPMVLNDAGAIGLTLNGKSYPATAPVKMNPGESLLLHYYNEGLQIHPMHLHHVPQLVVAKDGFPLEQPYWSDSVNVAPGERYSVLALPGENDIGVWAWHCHILSHAENDDGLFGMVTAMIVGDPSKAP